MEEGAVRLHREGTQILGVDLPIVSANISIHGLQHAFSIAMIPFTILPLITGIGFSTFPIMQR